MILAISHKLGLASIGNRFFGQVGKTQRVAGIEVAEYGEYTNPQMIEDARVLLDAGFAETTRVVVETRNHG